MQLYPKLGHGPCEIRWIHCECYVCTSMLDNICDPGVAPQKQPGYCPTLNYGTYTDYNNLRVEYR